MSDQKQDDFTESFNVIAPESFNTIALDGQKKVLKSFVLKIEGREITLMYLDDGTTVVNLRLFEDNEEMPPYTKLITNQTIRLTRLTFALLVSCLYTANADFGLNVEQEIAELNSRIEKKLYSDCVVCGKNYYNPEKDGDTCTDCQKNI